MNIKPIEGKRWREQGRGRPSKHQYAANLASGCYRPCNRRPSYANPPSVFSFRSIPPSIPLPPLLPFVVSLQLDETADKGGRPTVSQSSNRTSHNLRGEMPRLRKRLQKARGPPSGFGKTRDNLPVSLHDPCLSRHNWRTPARASVAQKPAGASKRAKANEGKRRGGERRRRIERKREREGEESEEKKNLKRERRGERRG